MTGLIRLIIAHYHDDCNTAATLSKAGLNVPRGWLIAVELCWECYLFVLSLCVISWGTALDKQVKQAVSDKCMGQFRFAENLNMYMLISRVFQELS